MEKTQPEQEPVWEGDLLKREKVANYLTDYLAARYASKSQEPGFVLAVNADWGFGKTFLLKKWTKQLQQSNYPAVYFDAWQNDFSSEPLIAFIAEIDESLKPVFKNIPQAKKLMGEAINQAKSLWKPVGKAAAQVIFKRLLGFSIQEVAEIGAENSQEEKGGKGEKLGDEIADSFLEMYESHLEDHISKKQAIEAFRMKLSSLVESLGKSGKLKLPLFFFIDELDRCRPNYAIELLEAIKHLFGVPGIYFIVATNLTQLGESTKAVYGQGFEGTHYPSAFSPWNIPSLRPMILRPSRRLCSIQQE